MDGNEKEDGGKLGLIDDKQIDEDISNVVKKISGETSMFDESSDVDYDEIVNDAVEITDSEFDLSPRKDNANEADEIEDEKSDEKIDDAVDKSDEIDGYSANRNGENQEVKDKDMNTINTNTDIRRPEEEQKFEKNSEQGSINKGRDEIANDTTSENREEKEINESRNIVDDQKGQNEITIQENCHKGKDMQAGIESKKCSAFEENANENRGDLSEEYDAKIKANESLQKTTENSNPNFINEQNNESQYNYSHEKLDDHGREKEVDQVDNDVNNMHEDITGQKSLVRPTGEIEPVVNKISETEDQQTSNHKKINVCNSTSKFSEMEKKLLEIHEGPSELETVINKKPEHVQRNREDAWKIDYIRIEDGLQQNRKRKLSKAGKKEKRKKQKIGNYRNSDHGEETTETNLVNQSRLPNNVKIHKKKSAKQKPHSKLNSVSLKDLEEAFKSNTSRRCALVKELIVLEETSRKPVKSSDTDQSGDCCPGCGDNFLIATAFFQHIYRKSAIINLDCKQCKKMINFSNKCLLRIHLLAHLELDKDVKFDLDDVDVVPHSENWCLSNNSQLHLQLHRSTVSDLDFDNQKCMECLETFPGEGGVKDHLLGANSTSDTHGSTSFKTDHHEVISLDKSLKCDQCDVYLQSACSLKTHTRIHGRKAPYLCPECGVEFLTWKSLKSHVTRSCFHEARCILLTCSRCPEFFCLSVEDAAEHVADQHCIRYPTCEECSRAFTTSSLLKKHMSDRNNNKISEISPLLLYKSPLNSTKLFKDKKKLLEHLEEEYNFDAMFGYLCNYCAGITVCADSFRQHVDTCQHDFTRGQLFADKDNIDKYLEALDDLKKHTEHLTCKGCVKYGKNFGSHIDKHHVQTLAKQCCQPTTAINSHTDDRRRDSDKGEKYKIVEDRSLTKLLDTKDMRETRNMRKIKENPSISPIKMKIKILSDENEKRDDKVSSASSSAKEKDADSSTSQQSKLTCDTPNKGKGKSSEAPKKKLAPSISTLGIDSPSVKDLIFQNQLENFNAFVQGSTVKKPGLKENPGPCIICGKCEFNSVEQFHGHIQVHRTCDPAVVQCKQCGACFASEPSWRRHLLLVHAIRTPDPDLFCSDLLPGQDMSSDLEDADDEGEDEEMEADGDYGDHSDVDEDDVVMEEPADDKDEEDHEVENRPLEQDKQQDGDTTEADRNVFGQTEHHIDEDLVEDFTNVNEHDGEEAIEKEERAPGDEKRNYEDIEVDDSSDKHNTSSDTIDSEELKHGSVTEVLKDLMDGDEEDDCGEDELGKAGLSDGQRQFIAANEAFRRQNSRKESGCSENNEIASKNIGKNITERNAAVMDDKTQNQFDENVASDFEAMEVEDVPSNEKIKHDDPASEAADVEMDARNEDDSTDNGRAAVKNGIDGKTIIDTVDDTDTAAKTALKKTPDIKILDNTDVATEDATEENDSVDTVDNTDLATKDVTEKETAVDTVDYTDLATKDATEEKTRDDTVHNTDSSAKGATEEETGIDTDHYTDVSAKDATEEKTRVDTVDETDPSTKDVAEKKTCVDIVDNADAAVKVANEEMTSFNTIVDNTDLAAKVATEEKTRVDTVDDTDPATKDITEKETCVDTVDDTDPATINATGEKICVDIVDNADAAVKVANEDMISVNTNIDNTDWAARVAPEDKTHVDTLDEVDVAAKDVTENKSSVDRDTVDDTDSDSEKCLVIDTDNK